LLVDFCNKNDVRAYRRDANPRRRRPQPSSGSPCTTFVRRGEGASLCATLAIAPSLFVLREQGFSDDIDWRGTTEVVVRQEGRKTKRRTYLPEAVDSAAPASFEVRRGSPTLSVGTMRFPSLATSEHPLSPVWRSSALEGTRDTRPAKASVSPGAPRRAPGFPKAGVLSADGEMGNSEIAFRVDTTLGSPPHAAHKENLV